MTACIINTETNHVFHIDADNRWVAREFAAFQKDAPAGKYVYYRITPREAKLIAAAQGGKLIVAKKRYNVNAFVPDERRAGADMLARLVKAHLVEAYQNDFRLTTYGEQAALVIADIGKTPAVNPRDGLIL